MIPRQPAEQIPLLLSACDVAFLSFAADDLWKMTIPAKLQSYMACGMPIIASARGETERIIYESECGLCSEVGDVVMLAKNIRKMFLVDRIKIKQNSRGYFEGYFKKTLLMNQMDKYIENLL